MERQSAHDYAAAMAHAQQQQQPPPYGYHQQQYPPPPQQLPPGNPPFLNPAHHPSLQPHQYPYHRPLPPLQQQQMGPLHLHPHHPSLLHMQQQQQQPLPSAFSSHVPPHLMAPSGSFPFQFDSAPPPVAPPPADPELHKCIDKLVEYVSKNGPEFEAMIREKQHDNPIYAFLFGGEGHGYYRYRLWLSSRGGPPGSPFNSPYGSSMGIMPPQMLNPPSAAGAPPHLHQSLPPYHDQQQQPTHSHPSLGYEHPISSFKSHPGPLPADIAAELSGILNSLTGTKESIKGAKTWFMQRSHFAPALVEALKERMFLLDDSERQMHIIFLANDILFDSLQRRHVPQELDSVAQAFKPVLGSLLGRIYVNPQNREGNQSRLEKILQFWASKEVFDEDTIRSLQDEMTRPPSSTFLPGLAELPSALPTEPSAGGLGFPASSMAEDLQKKPQQLHHLTAAAPPPLLPQHHQLQPPPPEQAAAPPPYPLFPPGLIPGMVRKMQVGSGVPYSPISPLDIPTVIPPSSSSPSEIHDSVTRFFKEIGEVNPNEGDGAAGGNDYGDWERPPPQRKGGACIPPPAALLQGDPDVAMERKGSGRLGLGAAAIEQNEVSQYDDVYSSYRKQRSSSYHSSMSARSSSSK